MPPGSQRDLPDFDRLARPYRWLEYLALGPLLARTRRQHLSALGGCRHALLLGDGDGRFCAALLHSCPATTAEAVDSSAAMLQELRQRTAFAASRRTTTLADLRTCTPLVQPDLITTHFVLDCLRQPEADALIARLAALLPAGGLWLVSDFSIPNGALHFPARLYVRALYLAFRMLTGLRVTRLPDHGTPLRRAGLVPVATHRRLGGLLLTELWRKP